MHFRLHNFSWLSYFMHFKFNKNVKSLHHQTNETNDHQTSKGESEMSLSPGAAIMHMPGQERKVETVANSVMMVRANAAVHCVSGTDGAPCKLVLPVASDDRAWVRPPGYGPLVCKVPYLPHLPYLPYLPCL